MLSHRVIPCLLLKDNGLVKTLKFGKAKYIGDPINAIRIFNDKEVDELMVLDIDASNSYQEPNFDLIEQFASECFMPLCYGGGIRTVEQVQRLFRLGVEKVCLQSAALKDITFIKKIADQFGSQSIVVSVDLKKNIFGTKKLFSSATKKNTELDWFDFIRRAVKAGAGEVLINSVDRDGTMQGMDLDVIRKVSQSIKVPIIAVGGVGSLNDIKLAIKAGASAVAAGSFFVFYGPHRAVLITYPEYHVLEELLG